MSEVGERWIASRLRKRMQKASNKIRGRNSGAEKVEAIITIVLRNELWGENILLVSSFCHLVFPFLSQEEFELKKNPNGFMGSVSHDRTRKSCWGKKKDSLSKSCTRAFSRFRSSSSDLLFYIFHKTISFLPLSQYWRQIFLFMQLFLDSPAHIWHDNRSNLHPPICRKFPIRVCSAAHACLVKIILQLLESESPRWQGKWHMTRRDREKNRKESLQNSFDFLIAHSALPAGPLNPRIHPRVVTRGL